MLRALRRADRSTGALLPQSVTWLVEPATSTFGNCPKFDSHIAYGPDFGA